MKHSEKIRDARELLRKEGYFVQNLWSTQDVIEYGKDSLGYDISEEQALEIFELLGRRFDASIGVNWDILEVIIEEFFKK